MARKKSEPAPAVIHAIKGFDANLQCRGFQFEIGGTYTHEGKVRAYEAGFHAITGHPLAVFNLECAASKVVYERRDTDGSALDLQEVAADRLAVIDGRERRRVDLVEAAQARRVERAGALLAKAA